MKIMLKICFLISVLIFFLSGCGENGFSIFSGIDGHSSLPDADRREGANSIPNDQYFYVRLKDAFYRGPDFEYLDYVMYERDGGPGYDCKIPVGQSSSEDMYCMFDIMEGDLFFNELKFEYNVPAGMCDYLSFRTHWHFNVKSGIGPKVIHKVSCLEQQGGDQIDVEDQDDSETDFYCLSPLDDGQACDTLKQNGCLEDHSELCKYKECCFGDYRVFPEERKEEWPGDGKNCIGGLGQTSWPEYTEEGFPYVLLSEVRGGLIDDYNIEAIIDTDVNYYQPAFSFVTANYWDGIEEGRDTPEFYHPDPAPPAFHSELPLRGSPYITWSCLDRADEVKHRIHLIIREWNTQEEFLLFKDSQGNRGDPDNKGPEGAVCDYYEQDQDSLYIFDGQCNDAFDADDWNDELNGRLGDIHDPQTTPFPNYPYPELDY